ncbi:hypothetical protein EXS57_02800 [Candidatus Kaiserbacteria bacterium]|nr:hypothetical protein [Candidatus Kaiserbacteria bacterium]
MDTIVQQLGQINTYAIHTALTVWNSASDFLIIIALVAFFFAFAWYVGRGPFVAIILSYYGAHAIYMSFPYMSYLPSAPPLTALLAHAGLYAALGFAFYVVMRRVVVSDFLYIGNVALIILSFFASAFLIALTYHVFPIDSVYHFKPAMDALFAPKEYFFWWFVAPAIGLFFLGR